MPDGRLIIGNKRYSSWSLRGWLAVRMAGLEVEEVVIPLVGGGGATPAVQAATPSGTVPSHARSLASEMHAGFRGLRTSMFFNAAREFPGAGRTPEALADIVRIERAWA